MNRLISGIALIALSCSSTIANTDDTKKDTFKIYGQAHVSLDRLDNSNDTNFAVSSNSSRLGVKGSTFLDNGWKAFYLAEWGVGYSGEKDWNNRNRYVGVKGSFGKILLGKHDTPMKKLGRSVDLFWSNQVGENRVLVSKNGFDQRYNNGILFSTGKPVSFTVAHYTDVDDDREDDNDNSVTSASVVYKGSNFMLGGGYEVVSGNVGKEDTTGARIVGSGKFGNFCVVGFFEAASDVDGIAGRDRNAIGIGGSIKNGKFLYKTQVYSMEDYDDVDDSGGTLVAVGVDYKYSKKVTGYVTAGSISNEDAASFSIVGVGHDDKISAVTGESNNGLSVGMRLKY